MPHPEFMSMLRADLSQMGLSTSDIDFKGLVKFLADHPDPREIPDLQFSYDVGSLKPLEGRVSYVGNEFVFYRKDK